MQVIKSKDNNTLKEIKKLKEKKYRVDNKKFIIEGFRFLEEGFKSDFIIDKLFIKESSIDKFNEKFSFCISKYDEKLFIINDNLFKSISGTENSQGVLAVLNMKEETFIAKEGLYILVDKVQDPGNLGTIIRTAHSAGCKGVILSKDTVDLYNEKTLRSTMGSIFNIPIIHDEDLYFTKKLIDKGYNLVCSSLQTDKNFFEVNLVDNAIIAVGNEGNGISDEVMNLATCKVKIPMLGNTESLNVAIAASIMIYEGVRQKISNKNY
ncbi:RNA methyltransferase [Clostridium subterminale]|uniref:RNA methyltransferase n=1 Tax=Clostridium subterminale TaxID=1550 RepID=A0ABN1KTP7_CLOSU